MDINKAADYIIQQIVAGGGEINNLKLHKLLYYVQAWHLALHGERMFKEDFQAWIHGPVNRTIYDRFKDEKMLYSNLSESDIDSDLSDLDLNNKDVQHIEKVLEVYGGYSGTQLEIATHNEEPWKRARKGYKPNQRCEEPISEDIMRDFYSKKLEN